jgi:hypothetical protein
MAWEYGTDWVAGFLAHQRQYVTGPPPANVGLWPIAPLTHPESEESEEECNNGQGAVEGTQGGEGPQGVTAPSGPVMTPPEHRCSRHRPHGPNNRQGRHVGAPCDPTDPHGRPHTGGNANSASDTWPREAGQHHRGTVAPGTAPYHRSAPPETGHKGNSRYAAGTAAHGWGGTIRSSR